jgi:hypothetical protein
MHLEHYSAGAAFFPQGIAYLQERFQNLPATSDCSTITKGNSLAPLK